MPDEFTVVILRHHQRHLDTRRTRSGLGISVLASLLIPSEAQVQLKR